MDGWRRRGVAEPRPARGRVVVFVVCLIASILWTGPVSANDLPPSAPLMPLPAEIAGAAVLHVSDVPDGSEIPDLGALSDAAWDLAETMPADRWVIEALAESIAYDPMAAFRFVRDHIRYEPYPGRLRGPEGTLAARAGNALDRSLLLAALLDLMLVEYRFATAALDGASIALALEAARNGPPEALDAELPGSRIAVEAIGRRARRDHARLVQALGQRFPSQGGHDEAAAVGDARDHVWLQIAYGAEWLDLDTTLPASEPGDTIIPAEATSLEPPAGTEHTVTIRLLVESLSGDALGERAVLEHRFEALDAADRELFLYFQPDLSGIGGAIVDVLSGDERWVPILLVDGEGVAGQSFSAGGAATDLLGDPTGLPELVSLRIEIMTTSPGQPDEMATHLMFDRRPGGDGPGSPISEDDLLPLETGDGAPLALAGIYHFMVSTGGASARWYAYEQSHVADFIADALLDPQTASTYSLADRLWPLAVADQGLVLASEQVLVPAAAGREGHGYVARPRVYLTSIGPDPIDVTTMTMATDLMIDGVRILPDAPGAPTAPRQVWYGVLQSALETEFGLRRAAAFVDPTDSRFGGVSFAMDGALETVAPDASVGAPAGSPPALRADLEGGVLVVMPADQAGGASSWWSIRPDTGVTRAMVAPGFHGFRDANESAGRRGEAFDNYYKQRGAGSKALNKGGGPKPHLPGDYKVPRATPRGCPPNEYLAIVGCVSLPQAIVLNGVSVAFVLVITWCAQQIWQFHLCQSSASYCDD